MPTLIIERELPGASTLTHQERRRRRARVYLGWAAVTVALLTTAALAVFVLWPTGDPATAHQSVSIRAIDGTVETLAAAPGSPSIRAIEGAEGNQN